MPVSNPSYFPPSRGTDQIVGITAGRLQTGARVFLAGQSAGNNSTISDFIAIGNLAAGAGLTQTLDSGTVVIGSQSYTAATNATQPSTGDAGPVTILGYHNLPSAVNRIGSGVFLGSQIYENLGALAGEVSNSVVIGSQAGQNHQLLAANSHSLLSSVIIGHRAARGVPITTVGGGAAIQTSVIIGEEAAASCGFDAAVPGAAISQCVIIGYQAGTSSGSGQNNTAQNNVLIGYRCAQALTTGDNNVIVGAVTTLTADSASNVVLGQGITANFSALGRNVIIGPQCQIGVGIGTECIVIGSRAGVGIPGNGNYYFNIETDDGSTTRAMFFGNMNTGNLVIGNSTAANQRALITTPNGATNIVGILNGTKSATSPIGGGYFYVTAGALHYVGTGGTDTTLAPA